MNRNDIGAQEKTESGSTVHGDTDDGLLFEVQTQDLSGVPIDRGWAWMAVLGCFGIHVFLVGGAKSLGVLIVEIRDRFEGISAKEMGLVQGLLITLTVGLGLVTNLLSARFKCRTVVFIGGLLACIGFTATAFVNEFWMVFLTYCIITGIGFALAYTPSIVFVGSHFKERRSLANGLSLAGSGIGSFILPNLMRVMLKEYGLPGCCMLMGALMLHICICGLLFRPHSNYRHKKIHIGTGELVALASSTGSIILTGTFLNQEIQDHVPSNGATNEKTYINHISPENDRELKLFMRDSKKTENSSELQRQGYDHYNQHAVVLEKTNSDVDKKLLQVAVNGSKQDKLRHHVSETKTSVKSDKCVFDWSLLTNPVFFLYILFAFFVNVGYPNIFFMLPVHAENEGEDRDSAALLLSFIGITDLIGRIFIGWFSDLKLVERRYLMVLFAFASGFLSLMMPLFKPFIGMASFAILYGFCAGSYVTLLPVTLSDLLGPEKLSSSLGMVSMALAATLIPAPLICGQIRDSTGSWDYAFIFVGLFAVGGSLFPLLQPCFKRDCAEEKPVTASGNLLKPKV